MRSAVFSDGANLKSVTRALELLSCFTCDHPEWGVTEIAEYLGLNKSAAHRVLATFEKVGFIQRTPSRRYQLGVRAIELGNMFQFSSDLIRVAEEPLRLLADETESISHLTTLDGRDTIEMLRIVGIPEIKTSKTSGRKPNVRREAHATSKGKIFLAFSGPEFFRGFIGLRQKLKQYTAHTIVQPSRLRQELQRIVEQGCAVDNEESQIGMRCLGVPVYSKGGKILAAISISGPSERFSDTDMRCLVPRVQRAAKVIERNLRVSP